MLDRVMRHEVRRVAAERLAALGTHVRIVAILMALRARDISEAIKENRVI